MQLLVIIITALLLLYCPVFASDQKLVNGAGTLNSTTTAFSLNLGLDVPEPLLYGVRFDFGIGDRVQLGLSGAFFFVFNTLGLNTMVNVFKTQNDSDFISIYFNPSVLHLANFAVEEDESVVNIWALLLRPGLAYEHRFGAERRTGLYTKIGSIHLLAASAGGKLLVEDLTTNASAINITPGWQHTFGERFSLTTEGSLTIPLQRYATAKTRTSQLGYGAKVGLTWAF